MNKHKFFAEKDKESPLDDVLRRMLSIPPKPHPKPAKKIANKKTAK
ncbi:MAG: hypothetical protein ACYCZH_02205 [Sulfuriferula sp.]